MPRFLRRLAVGDPQAPFATLKGILDAHGALGGDGKLTADVQLVSMGDHFDWGKPEQRAEVARDGLSALAWLASHDPEQVILLLGNHDLARVCELAPYTDESFQAVQREADAAYARGQGSEADEQAFLEKHPALPNSELFARDYSTFTVAQRELVTTLVRSGRFQLAHAHQGLLLVHAAVTHDDLEAAHAKATSAEDAAAGLNAYLAQRVKAWTGGALELGRLYRTGSASRGEARGAWNHRPADPSHEAAHKFEGPPRRRFDPRSLPATFPQAIGHIRDQKCRELMPRWHDGAPAKDGPLRSLSIEGWTPRYRHGAHDGARLYFLDGGMSHARVDEYELFDLDRRNGADHLR
jgi:hypothetical protein